MTCEITQLHVTAWYVWYEKVKSDAVKRLQVRPCRRNESTAVVLLLSAHTHIVTEKHQRGAAGTMECGGTSFEIVDVSQQESQ